MHVNLHIRNAVMQLCIGICKLMNIAHMQLSNSDKHISQVSNIHIPMTGSACKPTSYD